MKNNIFERILEPLTTRLGTIAAGVVIGGYFTDTSTLQELGTAISTIILIAGDLLIGRFIKKSRPQNMGR
ncbi:hypothetical protein HBA92_04320 [Ochrobactrum sp. MR28]|nr:hypothetical protein [Ochrobactrum sp. MR28]MBX8816293.1 hypothetical protein [Ochrobactrum sp. MR31]